MTDEQHTPEEEPQARPDQAQPETPPAADEAAPAAEETKTYDTSVGKADLGKRFVAALIDGVIGMVIGMIPVLGWIASPAYWLLRDGLEFEFMDQRSIGKKLMKLRAVTLEGKPLTIENSIRRNWPLALGGLAGIPVIGWFVILPLAMIMGLIELILTLTDKDGRRYGDRFAGTMVIESDE